MKPIDTYKMSKETKRLLMVTPIHKVAETKKLFIEAELSEAKAKQTKIRDNKKPDLEE